MRHPRRLLFVLLAVVLLAAACGGDGDESTDASPTTTVAESTTSAAPTTTVPSGPTIASLGGLSVSLEQIQAFAAQLGVADAEALDIWLLTTALEAELASGGRTISDLDLAEADLSLVGIEGEIDPLLRRANAVFVVARRVAEEEIADRADEFDAPEVLCSSHILVETEDEAAEVSALALAGDDFAELAMTYSTGPSGPRGGDLGCSLTAGYVPEFSDGARENGVGVTGPVQSQFGWHVIQVRSIGPGTVDVHAELTQDQADNFLLEAASSAVNARLTELTGIASERVARDARVDAEYGIWNVDLGRLES
ncbi:MAG: peptidylprolyl isomerase [Actinomycetota bacterium]